MPPRSEKPSFVAAALLALAAVLVAGFLVAKLVAPDAEPRETHPAPTRAAPASKPRAAREALSDRAANRRRRSETAQPVRPPAAAAAQGAVPSAAERPLAADRQRAARPPERGPRAAPPPQASGDAPARGGGAAAGSAPNTNAVGADFSQSAIDRALTDAGIAPAAMADIKLRYEELASAEKELHDEAAQDGWLSSPQFAEEMAAIEADRLSIRDEVGDQAYDLILFATGRTNRVLVGSVEPPVSGAVGELQAGDVIVSYDGVRIFSPAGLLTEMAAGTPGRTVRVDVLRQGNPLQLNVPDGPLPIGMQPAQEPPDRLR